MKKKLNISGVRSKNSKKQLIVSKASVSVRREVASELLIKHVEIQTKALATLANGVNEIAKFFGGQNIAEIMHKKGKADFVAEAANAAINKLGFDARRYKTFATELSYLVNNVYDKIEEREKQNQEGPTNQELEDAEEGFKEWQKNKEVKKDG